jgi:hypothetical protein
MSMRSLRNEARVARCAAPWQLAPLRASDSTLPAAKASRLLRAARQIC